MDDDTDFDGEDLARRLRRQGGAELAQALVGCAFYRDDPDAAATITACDPATGRITVRQAGGATQAFALATGYVLPDPRLAAVVGALVTPVEQAETALRQRIAAFGIRARIESDDLPALARVLDSATTHTLPYRDDRLAGLALMAKYGSAHDMARLTSAWLDAAGDAPPGEVLIENVAALRACGSLREALARTDVLRHQANGLDRNETSVLFTQRAAVLLDLHETRLDPDLLARARECASRSWAIAPSEECSMVYRRLAKLEAAQDSARTGPR